MEMTDALQHKIFMQLHEGLPRQSCGSAASTLRALSFVAGDLPPAPVIADLGCGPGSSVLPLASALPDAQFVALDLYEPFIDALKARAEKAGVAARIDARTGDMMAPADKPDSFDTIWCEGAIYNVGVEAGLRQWATYLKPGGFVVFNEPIWLTQADQRPAALADFWQAYPGMTDDDGVQRAIAAAGYSLIASFNLPENDWWDEYYTPLENKLAEMERTYPGAPPLEHTRTEIAMRRNHAAHYNYRFYCIQLAG